MIVSKFKRLGGVFTASDISVAHTNVLPVMFIPSTVVDRIIFNGLDYKTLCAGVVCNDLTRSDEGVAEFNRVVGLTESINVEVLNNRLVNNTTGIDTLFKVINFPLTENESNSYLTAVMERMSMHYDVPEYKIETDANGIFIIMNDNFFMDKDIYIRLSRDVAIAMLDAGMDESFVYQSAFIIAI